MGKLWKRKSKSNEKVNSKKPVPEKCTISNQGTYFPSSVEDNQPLTAIHTTAEIVKENVCMHDKKSKSILNISIDDNEHENIQTASNVTVPNIADSIIDIPDTIDDNKSKTISFKRAVPNTSDTSIIDITDTVDDNEYENSKTTSFERAVPNISVANIIDITDTVDDNEYKNSKIISAKKAVPIIESDNIIYIDLTMDTIVNNDQEENCKLISNDVQIVRHTTDVQKKPTACITLDDDNDDNNNDKESTLCQGSIEKSSSSRSIKEQQGISSKSKAIRRSHNPSRHKNKMFKNKNIFKHRFLPRNNRVFAANEQLPRYFNNSNPLTFEIPQPFSQLYRIPNINRILRPIIIDGLNIGHAHGSGTFSAKGIQLCIQYFANRGHTDIVVFIPQHRRGSPGSESNRILNELYKKGYICFTPSRVVKNLRMTCYEDRILLNYAYDWNGVVISNDNFRDLYYESQAIREIIENRHVMVTFFRDSIIVPEDQYNGRNHFRSLSDILCFA